MAPFGSLVVAARWSETGTRSARGSNNSSNIHSNQQQVVYCTWWWFTAG